MSSANAEYSVFDRIRRRWLVLSWEIELDFLIRPFEKNDTIPIIDLWRACAVVRSWNDPIKDIQRKIDHDDGGFLVVVAADRVIGSVMFGFDGHRGNVYYLCVHPDMQGHRIGKRLMATVEARLTALGCPKVNIMVRGTNTKVLNFYEKLGYDTEDIRLLGKRLIPD